MDAAREIIPPPARSRYLNVVYFVESARSHTIRINLNLAKASIGGLLVLCAWFFVSVVWIISLRWEIHSTRERLESSLATVFDYQIRNDKVFEQAYPAEDTTSYYSEAAQLASNNPTVDVKTSRPETAPNSNASASEGLAAKKLQSAPAKADSNQAAGPVTANSGASKTPVSDGAKSTSSADRLIDISNPILSKTNQRLTLKFAIKNSNPRKADGYIWAIATFKSDSGRSVSVGAPEHLRFDTQTGNIQSIRSAYRFSIQRYKDKTFDFSIPKEYRSAKLEKLAVYFSEVDGEHIEMLELPLTISSAALQEDTESSSVAR